MKFGPVTKLDKKNKKKNRQKNFDNDVTSENHDVIAIFQFTTNLEQSGSWILDT